MRAVEALLAKPMNPEAKKLLKAAVESNKKNALERRKYKLQDCSEVATVYHVQTRDRVKP
jgi:hypothetical protein